MLDPQQRQIYLDALAPPHDYTLDQAVATTYTLDLTALLIVPLSMTLFPCEDTAEALRDPIAVLEALRRNADRVTVFCQSGGIHVPTIQHRLFSTLEPMIVQVAVPPSDAGASRAIFHPKAWFLRFRRADGDVRYRFLCLSRNLTFDRSWDTMVALEGPLDRAAEPSARNAPLVDFVDALPRLAQRALPPERSAAVARLRDELPHVRFTLPDGSPFAPEALRFHALGVSDEPAWPFAEAPERLLVVSPFLSSGALRDLATGAGEAILVSRPDSLERLTDNTLDLFGEQVYVLHDQAEDEEALAPGIDPALERAPPKRATESDAHARSTNGAGEHTGTADDASDDADDDAEADTEADAEADAQHTGDTREPSGLHAKLVVAESEGRARVWTGSANATSALPLRGGGRSAGRGRNIGRARNVELLVELAGRARAIGIDRVLEGPDGEGGLRQMLVPWRSTGGPSKEAKRRRALEEHAGVLHTQLGTCDLRVRVEPDDDGERFHLVLQGEGGEDETWAGIDVRCWPVTLRADRAVALDADALREGVCFGPLSIVTLTGFIAFALHARDGEIEHTTRFALNLPLEGAPEDREAHVLRAIIADRQGFLRYLLFLLAEGDDGVTPEGLLEALRSDGDARDHASASVNLPLLEELVRALARSPEKIGRVKRVVDDLCATEDGRERLPEDFDAIWGPIQAAWRLHGERSP